MCLLQMHAHVDQESGSVPEVHLQHIIIERCTRLADLVVCPTHIRMYEPSGGSA